MNAAAEGTVYPDVPFTVDPERVAAFRRVFGVTEGVPPTFVTAAEFTVFPDVIGDPNLELDFSRVVHADQTYEFARPFRLGETVAVRPRIAQIRSKGGQSFLTIETTIVDDAGETVATARATMLERAET